MRKRSFKAESKRLLDLMINSIYTNKEIFLREIISNASDALDKLHYISLTDEKARPFVNDLCITISVDKENKILTVSDSGVGMTMEELEDNLGTIAKSGSLQFKEEQLKESEDKSDIIGQFGVGFYSSFMVSDEVTVISRRYDSDTAYKWTSDGSDGYTISECAKDSVGTDIIMHIKDDTENEKYSQYLESYKISRLVKTYSDYIRYPIKAEMSETKNVAAEGEEPKYEQVAEIKTLNSMIPVWQRSKSEVSDEECAKYYKDKFGDMADPMSVIRIAAEGVVSYKAMLFIPNSLPYGYYTKDFEKGLQLYSNGVLIMDKCADLLPEHFRFVKGVVDSADLSLNISREILQQDHQLKTIATNIEKKIKAELQKIQKNDFSKYEAFWKNFGVQIKYGVVNNYGLNKEMLKDLLVFHSSKGDELTTLAGYVENMPEDQKFIYYASGDKAEKIAQLPQTELCREKGFEMLYLTDEIDEFVIQALQNFEEKEFRNVAADDADLGSDESRQAASQKSEESKELLDFVKEILGEKIEKAVVSSKLKNHAVFISTTGPVTLEMEKYFASIPGEEPKPKSQKVLELNAEHKVFAALNDVFKNDPEKAESLVKILYNQALLMAGIEIEDTVEYCDMVCSLF